MRTQRTPFPRTSLGSGGALYRDGDVDREWAPRNNPSADSHRQRAVISRAPHALLEGFRECEPLLRLTLVEKRPHFDRGTCGQRRELSDGAEGQGISDDHGAPHLLEQMPEPRESTTPVIPTRTTPRVTSMV